MVPGVLKDHITLIFRAKQSEMNTHMEKNYVYMGVVDVGNVYGQRGLRASMDDSGRGIGVLFNPVYAMKAYGEWSCSSSHSSTGYQMKKCGQFHVFPMLPMEKGTW